MREPKGNPVSYNRVLKGKQMPEREGKSVEELLKEYREGRIDIDGLPVSTKVPETVLCSVMLGMIIVLIIFRVFFN